MKLAAAIATGVLLMSTPADAAPRPAIQHYGKPMLNGQRLPFSSAVRVGDILYLSGSIGRGPDGKPPEGIEAQTKATMDDIGNTLKLAGLGYDDLFHCTVFLSDMKNWAAFNQVYLTYFPDGPLPARSAVGVNGLALGALMEIECQAYAGKK
ncbi:MAG TPA: RidA family protein [Sphingomicrobium sp.]|nr:RidA family protein [Sphingomicrobium sp.]